MNPAAWLSATSALRAAHPGAALGVLALRGVANPPRHAALDERKAALERALRERYAGQEPELVALLAAEVAAGTPCPRHWRGSRAAAARARPGSGVR